MKEIKTFKEMFDEADVYNLAYEKGYNDAMVNKEKMKAYVLRPCPFCGGKPELMHGVRPKYDGRYFFVNIECTNYKDPIQVELDMEQPITGDEDYDMDLIDEAIAIWNRRVE